MSNQTALRQPSTLGRFIALAGGYWTGKGAAAAWTLTLVVLASLLGQIAMSVAFNSWNRVFFDALEKGECLRRLGGAWMVAMDRAWRGHHRVFTGRLANAAANSLAPG